LQGFDKVSGVSVLSRYVAGAVASSHLRRKALATDRNRFSNWRKNKAVRYETVETFIHEMTHMVSDEHISPDFKYKDVGHGENNGCSDTSLVSYSVGFAARDAYKTLFPF
jgi:hypothetical protein